MTASDARRLLAEAPCFSILPAGAGKTELLARCAAESDDADRRTLVLTHTNAGVEVLRTRIAKIGGDLHRSQVATIAGWCESLCRRYPTLARWSDREGDEALDERDYASIYGGASEVLSAPAIRRMLSISFARVLVDEYQDCSTQQHNVLELLSRSVPAIVLGDNLQAIFKFDGDAIDWDEDVAGTWPQVDLGASPRRWQDTNPRLGEQLAEIRDLLEQDEPVDLRRFSEIHWSPQTPANNTARPKAVAARPGSCLVVVQCPPQAVALAKRCGGLYGSLERLATTDLIEFATTVDAGDTGSVLRALFELAERAMARLPAGFVERGSRLAGGETISYQRSSKLGPLTSVALQYRESGELRRLSDVAAAIRDLPDVVVARQELWGDLELAIAGAARPGQTMTDAAQRIRETTRRRGRRPAQRVIGTTLLAKGLEFDHVVVTSADDHDRENLYVALTRATTSLEVLSESPVLRPSS